MPDYVYALHDFLPEHEDEVSFHTGERIEVVEKDDLYGDGWWQGRNLAGKVGLFPVSYTTQSDSSSSSTTALQPLHEESESLSTSPVSPIPVIHLNGDDSEPSADPNGEVMKATMTDVQKAIEQLGSRNRTSSVNINEDADARSFSFTSTRDDRTTDDEEDDTDFDMSEGEGWHKGARRKLAEKARQAVAEAEKLEALSSSGSRIVVPPISVELSDESDAEESDQEGDNNYTTTSPLREHPYIPEEEEPTESVDQLGRIRAHEDEPATAIAPSPGEHPASANPLPPSPGLPSPTAPASKAAGITGTLSNGGQSKHSSVASVPLSSVSEGKRGNDSGNASGSVSGSAHGTAKHPSEWTVEEVVEWLKSKSFDEDVCDKFTGIMAFGKRMRIANAIVELRRPPSPSASFSMPQAYNSSNSPQSQQYAMAYPSPQQQHYPNSPPLIGHSRTQSQSHSQQSYSAHHSMQSSVGSPLNNGYLAATYGAASGIMSPESAPHTGDLPGSPGNEPIGLGIGEQANGDGALNVSASQTNEIELHDDERAVMSESELPHATNPSVRRRLFGARSPVGSPHEKDKDSAKDKNSTKGSTKESASSKDADSCCRPESRPSPRTPTRRKKAPSRLGQVVMLEPGRALMPTSPKGGERLSIFGASFGGTLGRKPAPRYSGGPEEEKDKSSSSFLPRLHRKGGRPSTPNANSPDFKAPPPSSQQVAKGDLSPTIVRDSNLLRKRTSSSHASDSVKAASTAAATVAAAPNGVPKLKPGQSVLEQIGEPDHVGWMRKKGDRYNSWKLRYLVLKGPDLYCLRSSNKTETKIKGYINIIGYKVTVDENVDPGRYGFRIDHDHDKTHYFSSDEKMVVRDWMKAIMKATIGRDYSKPVVSSCNIPTIPLMVAQAMNPAPRPPSPTARAATQRAMRRENTDQPSTRDARVLMLTGFTSSDAPKEERARLDSFFAPTEAVQQGAGPASPPTSPRSSVPPRPNRRLSSQPAPTPVDESLIKWANTHLPTNLQINDPAGPLCDGLGLLRLAESIKGRPSSPPVPDSAFPKDPTDDNLDGLFRLFDFLLDNEVRMGSVSINDIRMGNRDKIVQLLRGLKGWEDKRMAIATSIGKGSAQAGGFMAPAWSGV
ncbi:hypothetical protein C8J57DRAFT_1267884 [Mycena rebaudengoi]|nr:hypothetical protein C8J57DRAFT_1267884 [Mycena rebaudengoi]